MALILVVTSEKTFTVTNVVHTQVLFLTITIFGIFMTQCKLDCSEWAGC